MIARIAIPAAIVAVIFGSLLWRLQVVTEDRAELRINLSSCAHRLNLYIEGDEIDDAIPLDLDGFAVPDHWMSGQ